MKTLIIGSGGREHALVWALGQSSGVEAVFSATSNAGIIQQTKPADVGNGGIIEVTDFAVREGIDLVIIGPEQPLVDGMADALKSCGIAVFGPSASAARLEGSKIFAKKFMARHKIPTAECRIVDDAESGFRIIRSGELGYPLVIKADGLAAGKGVIIAGDEQQAISAIQDFMIDRKLGGAGERLLIEECLTGRELSYLVFSDGKDYEPMPVAQDHKRAFDGDKGPNTGGMGAFSTNGLLDKELEDRIRRQIVEPSLEGTASDGFPFCGVLYCGLMLTDEGPEVLEYNVRFGDPETQAILRRLDSDFCELAYSVADGSLAKTRTVWSEDSTTCIVLASNGYPGNYETGKGITGIEEAESLESVVVFHAGTKHGHGGMIETSGGRVLGVTSRAKSLEESVRLAYEGVSRISFDGVQYRSDIGFISSAC